MAREVEDPQAEAGRKRTGSAPITLSAQAFRELFGMAGAGLAGYGAWLHYQPAGFMVGGAIMVALCIVGTLRGSV